MTAKQKKSLLTVIQKVEAITGEDLNFPGRSCSVEQFCVLFMELKTAMREYNDVCISESFKDKS